MSLSSCPWWGCMEVASRLKGSYSSTVIVTAQLSSSFSHVSHTSFPLMPLYFKWKNRGTISLSKIRVVSPRTKTVGSWFTLISPLGLFNTSHPAKGKTRKARRFKQWSIFLLSSLLPSSHCLRPPGPRMTPMLHEISDNIEMDLRMTSLACTDSICMGS